MVYIMWVHAISSLKCSSGRTYSQKARVMIQKSFDAIDKMDIDALIENGINTYMSSKVTL